MPLAREAEIGPGHIVLDGDLALPRKGHSSPLSFRPMSIVARRSPISTTTEHLFYFAVAASSLDAVYWIYAWLRFHVLQNLDSISSYNRIAKRSTGWHL